MPAKLLTLFIFLTASFILPSSQALAAILGDANNDGQVNGQDYVIWLTHYAAPAPVGPSDGDFNSNGTVDGQDYVIWLTNYGAVGPTSTPAPTSSPSEWTQFGHDPQRTSYTSQTVTTPWKFKWEWNGAGADGKIQANHLSVPSMVQPVTGGNRVYIVAADAVYALDKNSTNKANGTVLWTKSGLGTLSSTPVYENEFLYVAGGSTLYKLNAASGAVVSSYTASSPLSLASLLVGANLYLPAGNGSLISVDKNSMTKVWEYAGGSVSATPATYSPSRNILVYLTQDLFVHAVNLANGTLKWKVKPTNRVYQSGSPGSGGAQAERGWPVIAEQHGLVFIRYRLDWQSLWEPGVFPNTNAKIRTFLTANPQYQALFPLNLDTGAVAFIPAVGNGGAGDGGNLPMGPQPIVKVVDSKEVVYIIWRNAQVCGGCESPGSCTAGGITQWCDGREDASLGEMVLDATTVSGYSAGDVRFVGSGKYIDQQGNYQNDIQSDEMLFLTMSGNTIFHGHWVASQNNTITDRSSGLGSTFTNPVKTVPAPNVIWRQVYCPDSNSNCNPQYFPGGSGFSWGPSDCPFNTNTRYCSAGLYTYGDQRAYGPGFYEYHNDRNSGTTAFTIVSNNLVLVKTNDGAVIALENGNPLADAGNTPDSSVVLTAQSAAVSVSWLEADRYMGQKITVTGKIVAVENHLPKAMYLGFTSDPRNSPLLLRVFAKDISKFPYPLESLKNKSVKITGPVTLYWPDGVIPEIVITDPSQIQ